MKKMKVSNIYRKRSVCNPDKPRKFYIYNEIPPNEDPKLHKEHKRFPKNEVKTSSYTLLNFVPKNLFQQFRRIANFYFLCLCVIHFTFPSPVSPLTSFLPLVFVVTVTAIKQGYEDWKKHREDNLVNKKIIKVLKNGELQDCEQSHVQVGDIIKVSTDEEFPCDILLLLASEGEQKCDVTTANLDGETHIKTFITPFNGSYSLNEESLKTLRGSIECQHPHPNLYDFKGCLTTSDDVTYSLSTENLLLRGARLKNTDYIYGVAVYTGKDSKMALNLKMKTGKFSTAERACNFFLLFNMALLVVELGVTTVAEYFQEIAKNIGNRWYLPTAAEKISNAMQLFDDCFAYFILYSYIIPISLYVSLEVQKFLGSFFFEWDEEMRNPETGEAAICNTSDLNEELGQVEYLFTDKTGTLTENCMKFKQCSISGVKFAEENSLKKIESVQPTPENMEVLIENFLVTLALCHTVQAKPAFPSENVKDEEHVYINPTFIDKEDQTATKEVINPLYSSNKGPNINGNLLTLKDRRRLVEERMFLSKYEKQSVEQDNCMSYGKYLNYKEELKPKFEQKLRNVMPKYTMNTNKLENNMHEKYQCGFQKKNSIPLMKSEWNYFASSPDEKALVESCTRLGVIYEGKKDGRIQLDVFKKKIEYSILEILEFDSERKMMSVMVQDEKGKIYLLAKGAEITILGKCVFRTEEEKKLMEVTTKHINEFAKMGLRTLAVAKREMTREEFDSTQKKLEVAKREIKNREMALKTVMDEVETGFSLLGATGVEDLLQEGVPETLESMVTAGIKVWVLTGDKIETAVNIAHLAGIFSKFTTVVYLTQMIEFSTIKLELQKNEKEFKDSKRNFGLVVDGTSLIVLLEEFRETFFRICSQCSAVICCRMTPKQKAEVVHLVKSCNTERTICAAVGDGANDVSMIQEAHVGIGIMGKEGRQAVRSSDFAVGKFRFLQRALLVHGHWYYTRISTLILYSFYKNIAFITPQIFFSFMSAFSTESVYEGLILTLFNTIFTAIPIIVYGLVEQVYGDRELLSKPYLYKEIRKNKNLSWRRFLLWTSLGFWHAFVLYFGLFLSTRDASSLTEGRIQDLFFFGMTLTTNVVFVVNLKLVLESRYQTWIFWGSILFTAVIFYITYLIYCGTFVSHQLYWTFYLMHTTPTFYISLVLLLVICLLPDVLIKVYSSLKLKFKNIYSTNN